ncbi:peptidoglycan-binding protein [Streptomyces polygonati]|uniref:Peptidoglycan-binding protein n=1 Tax=Streptomyces polygonati TaxID=1617087 RepID=A0ABV8HWX0_9ACTN
MADAVADGGEIRAAERSAERAAAVAATEGFHPLRIRPYVAEPDGDPGERTPRARPLIPVYEEEPETADLRLFPSMYSGVEYAPEEPPPFEPVALRGRHRRRRRSIVVAAAAVAASALAAGAVAVTGQVMGDEQGTADRAMPDLNSSVPDVQLPHVPSPRTSESAAPPEASYRTAPTNAPTTAATPSVTPTATPSASIPVTMPSAAPPGTATATPPVAAPDTPSATPASATPTAAPTTTAPPPTVVPQKQPLQPDDTLTLRLGDSGSAVLTLQHQLNAAHVYHGPYNGVFDYTVEMAVTTFQLWHHVSDSPLGTYGPNTRAALTSPSTRHH